jgi:hypothetical protein
MKQNHENKAMDISENKTAPIDREQHAGMPRPERERSPLSNERQEGAPQLDDSETKDQEAAEKNENNNQE